MATVGSIAASHSSGVAPAAVIRKRDRGRMHGDADRGLAAAADQVGQHLFDVAFAGAEALEPMMPDHAGRPAQTERRPARRSRRNISNISAGTPGKANT